ncbi:MAG TPA: NAD(P)/FAD-dependent oxidoreductase [Rhabdochlamydiaceae bacterium]|jgi:2-polyprenyl-6-methoxyphenol hydroxylase-like FAD-dependent oxidoreductase|nr:NAD(P)/FAD-dependent oxidoreductase [Rhabdochlamydiaceae bacterium]
MKSVIIFILILFNLELFADQSKEPPSVVIIGGGPAGLATAIEAHQSGAVVTVVEKRDSYSRPQILFLLNSSIKLLEKWKVAIPQMRVIDLGDGDRIGFVQIKHLEESLENRVKELGIQKITGEFKELSPNALLVTSQDKELILSYDILVGADGVHSRVRDALGISMNVLGTGKGAFAVIRQTTSTEVDISPAIKQDGLFLRRMKVPSASVIFIQSSIDASKNLLQKAIKEQGWHNEAEQLDKAIIGTDIPITLQQAQTFSNEKESAILVGDAAATASFFQGMGANTALKTAEIAGNFFKNYRTSYQEFNRAMKNTTDELIEDSRFLFVSETPTPEN